MNSFIPSIYLILLIKMRTCANVDNSNPLFRKCPVYKKETKLNLHELAGNWMSAYKQLKSIDCFKFNVRATTELEREQYTVKYGNFKNRVDWNKCLLQVETTKGKHFLQGTGEAAGLLENIFIAKDESDEYVLRNNSVDQWMVFGPRGKEKLVIRDCYGETVAAFARAPYWPTMTELLAIFHRNGIKTQTSTRSLCRPDEFCKNVPL